MGSQGNKLAQKKHSVFMVCMPVFLPYHYGPRAVSGPLRYHTKKSPTIWLSPASHSKPTQERHCPNKCAGFVTVNEAATCTAGIYYHSTSSSSRSLNCSAFNLAGAGGGKGETVVNSPKPLVSDMYMGNTEGVSGF